jgi:surfactin synthase thioesterase subunit
VYLFVSGMVAPQRHVSQQPLDDDHILDEVRMLGGTPDALLADPELMEIMLPVLRADFNLVRAYGYYPGEPLMVPIISMGGLEDPYTTDDGLLAWQVQTHASFSCRRWRGGHFYLHDFTSEVMSTIADSLGFAPRPSWPQSIGASRTLS